MADYRRPLEFGVNIIPAAATVDEARMLARRADAAAIDLIGIQDHCSISFSGRHYSVKGVHPGPAPTHPMGIWVGALQPRMLRLTGRLADGWVPSLPYAPPPQIPAMQRLIDAGATEVERDPTRIRRIYNVMGRITDGPATKLLEGPPSHWIEEVSRFVTELGFDTFVFWPNEDPIRQVERFINDVVPGVREQVARARR
jgi:Luciferase-like monooxygenase